LQDAGLGAKAAGNIVRAQGKMQLAKGTGINREGLYKALGEQGNPSFATVVKVIHALGMQFNVGARSVQS
jgi:probable addiction module antidote protein